ncbi:unnamed protein product, partial [Brenthis ino]
MPIGKLEPFDLNSKQWPAYIRRVKQYIILNEIKDELQVPLLITVVGETTYSLMCDLCSPTHPESRSFDDLVKLVSDHLEPQRSEIAERHVFRLRRQRVGEPLSEYLQNLKHLATTCNFGTMLEENLRDQFVSGLVNEAMRSRIFAERNIKYKEAVELALALEAAEKHAEVSGATAVPTSASGAGGEASEGLFQTSAGRKSARPVSGAGRARVREAAKVRCWRCGKLHHASKCRFAQYSCDKCHKKDHLKVMCDEVRNRPLYRNNYYQDGSSTEEEDIFNIELISKGNKPYLLKLIVDKHLLEFEIDTGSRISAISQELFNKIFTQKTIISDNLLLRCYTGLQIESMGFIYVNVSLGSVKAEKLSLYIIKNGSRPLLGRDWIRALKIKRITLKEIQEDSLVEKLIIEYPEVFTDKLGTCKKHIELQLIDKNPVYVRARVVPLALRKRAEPVSARKRP